MKRLRTHLLSLLALPALLSAGCFGHFDTYSSHDTSETILRSRQKTLFPQVHFVGAALPGFTVIHRGRLLSTFDSTDGVMIFAVADRHGTRDLVPWVDYISRRYGPRTRLVPIINLHEEHWFKKTVLRAFIAGSAYTIYFGHYWERRIDLPDPLLDWSGRVQRALALSGHGPFVVVSNNGRIVGFFAGRAVSERVSELTSLLDGILPVSADVPPPDVPAPFSVGRPEPPSEALPAKPGPEEPLEKLLEPTPGDTSSIQDTIDLPQQTPQQPAPDTTPQPSPLDSDVRDILETLGN